MRYEIRPLVAWTDPETDPRRGAHIFRASWRDTLDLLAREVEHLEAADPVVLQVDVRDGDIRRDGMLAARAKVGHPGVAVSFASKFGPLRYATDAYERQYSGYGALDGWQANVRAIALALEALRAVDRYGVSKRGEQYRGWRALTSGAGETFPSADEALRWMREMSGDTGSLRSARLVYRDLARKLHPDAGGDPADWDRLDAAKLLLTEAKIL